MNLYVIRQLIAETSNFGSVPALDAKDILPLGSANGKLVSADGQRTIAEYKATAAWRCDGVADVLADIAPYGLTLTEHVDCVVVRRP